ncbi:MAG: hypothetical protein A2381_09335 [Bdellovibrionales bacterium RIFOXYB1_FULL_37_110]|nr:MAG: hypothetical protein A2417_14375 [Bdellovibrionales bacterium RIFOXYC1_FULL_37_79]OFZ56880.1 MAG: hypothetical protein A2381_09335 [Bdellovibrionales bacterium RIFOXYB1_FULL_37_110]OFZ65566.1 MAG: hypothetical protein A2577_17290 [Bdellovibrionales bacterium RIFOXYD1_FULL_36_51]
MKIIIVLVFILTVSAFAQDRGRNSPREIRDLMYLPLKQTFFGSTKFKTLSRDYKMDYNANEYCKTEQTASYFIQELGYSFTDTFSLRLEGGVSYFS